MVQSKACSGIAACSFVKDHLGGMPSVAAMCEERYCLGDYQECARLRLKELGFPVPPDLFPNQHDRAASIIG